jgi:ABC-type antimicrobial peptide transport system permease subunit
MEFFVVLLFLLAVRYWWGELPRLGRGLLPRWLGVVKAQLNGVPFYLVAVILPAFCVGYLAEALEAEVLGLLTLMIHITVLIIVKSKPKG